MVHCSRCGHSNPDVEHPCERCGATLVAASSHPALPPQLEAELRMLLREGQKIRAIKRLRESTGAGLKEAKDAVEAIERGHGPASAPAIDDDRFRGELVDLLREGRKIEAIKRYRARTGADLKAAKDAVEALGVEPVVAGKSGCLSALLLVALGLAAGWVVGCVV